jgi:hypothetical protein
MRAIPFKEEKRSFARLQQGTAITSHDSDSDGSPDGPPMQLS